MDQASLPESQSQLIEMRMNTLIQVVLLGVIVGAVTWLLALVIDRFIIGAVFCAGQPAVGFCGDTAAVSGNIALVLTGIGGLLGLVRLGVYRPLLIVIAASIVLWGLLGVVSDMLWFEALAWTVFLYAVVYAAFAWLVRPRLFLFAIILVLAVVIAARVLPVLP